MPDATAPPTGSVPERVPSLLTQAAIPALLRLGSARPPGRAAVGPPAPRGLGFAACSVVGCRCACSCRSFADHTGMRSDLCLHRRSYLLVLEQAALLVFLHRGQRKGVADGAPPMVPTTQPTSPTVEDLGKRTCMVFICFLIDLTHAIKQFVFTIFYSI